MPEFPFHYPFPPVLTVNPLRWECSNWIENTQCPFLKEVIQIHGWNWVWKKYFYFDEFAVANVWNRLSQSEARVKNIHLLIGSLENLASPQTVPNKVPLVWRTLGRTARRRSVLKCSIFSVNNPQTAEWGVFFGVVFDRRNSHNKSPSVRSAANVENRFWE